MCIHVYSCGLYLFKQAIAMCYRNRIETIIMMIVL